VESRPIGATLSSPITILRGRSEGALIYLIAYAIDEKGREQAPGNFSRPDLAQ
jgi:hypothetical protein